jgi:peptide/nickel transport system ATP-binding protein
MSEIFRIKNLTLHFLTFEGTVKALEDVNLTMFRGETLGLVGETGCGKTVTSRSLMRLMAPNARVLKGEVVFDGRNVLQLSEKELESIRGKEISMVFQEPMRALNPTMTFGDQITEVIMLHFRKEMYHKAMEVVTEKLKRSSNSAKSLLLTVHKRLLSLEADNKYPDLLQLSSRLPFLRSYRDHLRQIVRERIVDMLKQVQIPNPQGVVDQYPHELSGGMRQRAMIAMALACSPKLVIADEPTTALDVTVQARILRLMQELKDRFSTSILLVTHNLGVVSEICDRVAVMYAGTVVELADVVTIFRRPIHPYTRGLIEAIHNPGDVRRDLREIKGTVPSLLNPPKGCRFSPRCDSSKPVCKQEMPKTIEVDKGHFVTCYLAGGVIAGDNS